MIIIEFTFIIVLFILSYPHLPALEPCRCSGHISPSLVNQACPQTYLVGPLYCLDRPARGTPICRRYIIITVALHFTWLSTSRVSQSWPHDWTWASERYTLCMKVIHFARYFSLTPYAFLFPRTGQPRRRSARTRPTTTTTLSQTVTVTQPPALAMAPVPRSSPPTTATSSQAPATLGTTAHGIAQTTVTQSMPPAPTPQLAPPSTTAIVQPPPPPGTSIQTAVPTSTLPPLIPMASYYSYPPTPPMPPIPTWGGSPNQQPGYPPQCSTTNQQPRYPQQPTWGSPSIQQPGYSPQGGTLNQQPGSSHQNSASNQQPGYPQPQQPGYPQLAHPAAAMSTSYGKSPL